MPTSSTHGSGTSSERKVGSSGSAISIESLVCFSISGRTYAIDVALVREVVNLTTIFPVPQTPDPVAGVFSLRGATVALVDTPRLLGIESSTTPAVALIVVRNHQTVCGMSIDRVVGVTRFVDAHFIAADPEREPATVIGFMPDERGGLLTILDSNVVLTALNRLRFR